MESEQYRELLKSGSKKLKEWIESSFKSQEAPVHAITLGSGLNSLKDLCEIKGSISFETLGLPTTHASGHTGEFLAVTLFNKSILLQSGRLHCYEGHSGAVAALPSRILAACGIKRFIITNAAGSLDKNILIGDLVLLTGNKGFLSPSPSIGLKGERIGEQFYSTTDPYDRDTIAMLSPNLHRHKGSYVYMPGPRYEERTEIISLVLERNLFFEKECSEIAPTAVGMSTVPEVHALCQARTLPDLKDIKIIGISLITNHAAGLSDTEPTHAEVLEAGKLGTARMIITIEELLQIF